MKDCLGAVVNMIWHEFRAKWAAVFGSRPVKSKCAQPISVRQGHARHTSAGASTKLGRQERGKDKIQLIGCNMHASAWGGVCSYALDTAKGPRVEGRWCDLLESICCLARPSEKLWVATLNKDGGHDPSTAAVPTHSLSFILFTSLLSCYSVALLAW